MIAYEISVYKRDPETKKPFAQLFATARKSITSEDDLAIVLTGFDLAFPDEDYETVVFVHEYKTTRIKRDGTEN